MTATASAVDAAAYGEFRSSAGHGPSFTGRLDRVEAGRYHVYTARTSPAGHRLELVRLLAGLADAVSLSHVHDLRDARGWAFRPPTGPDPVNGFTLLREAYEATAPGWAGPVRVPLLWDRATGTVVSDDATTIGIDLARAGDAGTALYPAVLAAQIERAGAAVETGFTGRLVAAARRPADAAAVRHELRRLDGLLAGREYLLGDDLTDADLRLWPALVRYDVGSNAHRTLGPALTAYPALWRYARRLFDRPEFRATTSFEAFAAPFADLGPWID